MSNDANKLRQRQEIRKYLVFAGMFLLFVGCMWLIFAPSKEERQREERNAGFNSELPDPRGAGIEADKIAAYEQADMKRRQEEKMRTLEDFSALADENRQNETSSPVVEIPQERESESASSYRGSGNRRNGAISSSTSAYNDINATLGSFYEAPRQDPEKEELRARLAELENRMSSEQQSPAITVNDQMALLEKSYQLAAKYMPSGGGQQLPSKALVSDGETASERKAVATTRNGKAVAFPVAPVSEQVVSALAQPMSDSTFRSEYVKERNFLFQTAIGTASQTERNTISACVHNNQTVTDGQIVRFRLLEPMLVSGWEIPRNAFVVGTTKLQGERLAVVISSLEYHGNIIPVELAVYDTDGQAGIFIPGSMERSAAKEIVAGMGTSAGSSMNFSTDAGAQLAADLGKGLIQGTSQYFSKKMRTVKVHLKAGYKVLLYQPDNK